MKIFKKHKNKKNLIFSIIIIAIIALFVLVIAWKLGESAGKEADRSLSAIKKKGKIIVGTFPEFKLLTYKDEANNNIGYDMDVIKNIAEEINVEIEVKEIFFNDLFWAVKSGAVDVAISAVTITPERSKDVLFSTPYFESGQSIVVLKGNEDIKGPEDLKDKKIGVPKGTTCETVAKKYVDPYFISYYDFKEIDYLLAGTIDAVIHDSSSAAESVKDNPDKLKIAGGPISKEYFGIMTKQDNNKLIDKIDEILREMKLNGELEQIKNKWFNSL